MIDYHIKNNLARASIKFQFHVVGKIRNFVPLPFLPFIAMTGQL